MIIRPLRQCEGTFGKGEARAVRPMPIRAAPYRCQIAALNFARGLRSILFCGGEGER